jgi:hypothetical protein
VHRVTAKRGGAITTVRRVLSVLIGFTLFACHGAEAGYPTADEIAWDLGVPDQDPPETTTLSHADGGWFELRRSSSSASGPATIARHDASGNVAWRVDAPCCWGWASADGGTMACDDARLFVAQYSPNRAGIVMFALDAASGSILWPARVFSIGWIKDHSLYYQHVTLKMVRGALVLYGNELDRGCIEVFSPDGNRLSDRLLSLAR